MIHKDSLPKTFVFFVKGFLYWKSERAIRAEVGKLLFARSREAVAHSRRG